MQQTVETLLAKTQKNENGCLEWIGSKTKFGHGRVRHNGLMVYPHRLMYELANGVKIPDKILVCHRCDNPKCINPQHLFLGTYSDNMQDCISKGRFISRVPDHGTWQRYHNHECRCGLCKQAASEYKRKEWKEKHPNAIPRFRRTA